MNFSQLHNKLAFTYLFRISMIYPSQLNGNKLSYLFSDEFTGDTLEVTITNGVLLTITETVDKVSSVTSTRREVHAIQTLVNDYFTKRQIKATC